MCRSSSMVTPAGVVFAFNTREISMCREAFAEAFASSNLAVTVYSFVSSGSEHARSETIRNPQSAVEVTAPTVHATRVNPFRFPAGLKPRGGAGISGSHSSSATALRALSWRRANVPARWVLMHLPTFVLPQPLARILADPPFDNRVESLRVVANVCVQLSVWPFHREGLNFHVEMSGIAAPVHNSCDHRGSGIKGETRRRRCR